MLVFYSANSIVVDYQRLTKTTIGLGTTFPLSLVLGSRLFLQRRRHGHPYRHQRLVGVAERLTAQHKPFSLKQRFDFLQIVQASQDLGPLPDFAFFLQPPLQLTLEQQRQKTTEHM